MKGGSKRCLQCRHPWFDSYVKKIPWRRDRLPIPVFLSFPGSSASKESAWNSRDLGSNPGLGRYPRGGHGYPLKYSCLENSQGQRSLVGYSPWGRKESDMTEQARTQNTKRCRTSSHVQQVGGHQTQYLTFERKVGLKWTPG